MTEHSDAGTQKNSQSDLAEEKYQKLLEIPDSKSEEGKISAKDFTKSIKDLLPVAKVSYSPSGKTTLLAVLVMFVSVPIAFYVVLIFGAIFLFVLFPFLLSMGSNLGTRFGGPESMIGILVQFGWSLIQLSILLLAVVAIVKASISIVGFAGWIGKNRNRLLASCISVLPFLSFALIPDLAYWYPETFRLLDPVIPVLNVEAYLANSSSEDLGVMIVAVLALPAMAWVYYTFGSEARFDEGSGAYLGQSSHDFSVRSAVRIKRAICNPSSEELAGVIEQKPENLDNLGDSIVRLKVWAGEREKDFEFGYVDGDIRLNIPSRDNSDAIKSNWRIFSYKHPREKIDLIRELLDIS